MAVSGRLAQWLERMLHTHEVTGSSPVPPTTPPRIYLGFSAIHERHYCYLHHRNPPWGITHVSRPPNDCQGSVLKPLDPCTRSSWRPKPRLPFGTPRQERKGAARASELRPLPAPIGRLSSGGLENRFLMVWRCTYPSGTRTALSPTAAANGAAALSLELRPQAYRKGGLGAPPVAGAGARAGGPRRCRARPH